uniref:Uncharacterized protein n=1 Tax=Oryza nivara TaxID=4536 RepID=A0A0E0HB00_ORYNI
MKEIRSAPEPSAPTPSHTSSQGSTAMLGKRRLDAMDFSTMVLDLGAKQGSREDSNLKRPPPISSSGSVHSEGRFGQSIRHVGPT